MPCSETFVSIKSISVSFILYIPVSFLTLVICASSFCFFCLFVCLFLNWSLLLALCQFYWSFWRMRPLFHWFSLIFCFQFHWFLMFIISFFCFIWFYVAFYFIDPWSESLDYWFEIFPLLSCMQLRTTFSIHCFI